MDITEEQKSKYGFWLKRTLMCVLTIALVFYTCFSFIDNYDRTLEVFFGVLGLYLFLTWGVPFHMKSKQGNRECLLVVPFVHELASLYFLLVLCL